MPDVHSVLLIMLNFIMFYEVNKFAKNFKDKFISILIINSENLVHGLAGIITLAGLRKLFDRKIYLFSKSNH